MIVVPAGSEISSLSQLAKPGVKLVIGDESVPVGAYTREVLGRLPQAEREAILANVRSEEPEVAAVVAKVVQGAADAGFVYRTDAVSAGDAVTAIEIPRKLQPDVAYGGAVVNGSGDPEAASQFIAGLLDGEGAEDLRRAGFLPPPMNRRSAFFALAALATLADARLPDRPGPRRLHPGRPGEAARRARRAELARSAAAQPGDDGDRARRSSSRSAPPPPTCSPAASSAAGRWS